ncbi:hypothetical protein [Mycobacterium marinum]|uniref:hypothetical protein n=1 Tax=Mycobacterium marinum TaxID=1781 RepID=UPI00235A22D5|nr:hypothetical protein [Mycobacterium marinum]MDC9003760.1 hypothetical protein [Mycobacterium marinum]
MSTDMTKPGDCPVCEEPWELRQDEADADVWRFVRHNRTYVHKGQLRKGESCPGAGKTYEQGLRIKAELDATRKPFPAE